MLLVCARFKSRPTLMVSDLCFHENSLPFNVLSVCKNAVLMLTGYYFTGGLLSALNLNQLLHLSKLANFPNTFLTNLLQRLYSLL